MTGSAWPGTAFSSEKVAAANVLMIGAGGIGCELIKTLVMTGFRNVTMVDMDTIEISNLNRQFLFRKRHVGKSKAETAAEAVRSFCPDAKIRTLQQNVKDSLFDLTFMKTFDIVLNGLDNDEARRHVNRLCLAADVPLIESGTTGYKGQVTVHLKGKTECFECSRRPAAKGFPICTIRNTPEKPIHCIVWAKDLLFERLFGPVEAENDLDEVQGDEPAAAAEAGAPPASDFLRKEGEDAWEYALRVFDLVYVRDVERVAGIDVLWEKRPPPKPLTPSSSLLADFPEPTECSEADILKFLGLNPREEWTMEQTAKAFVTAIYVFHKHRQSDIGSAHFTKDDALSVVVVSAASNLRSICYDIPAQSQFSAMGMAGNIIHAIATTNAVVGGLITLEAVKVLTSCKDACVSTYLTGATPNQYGKLSTVTQMPKPKPECMVCGHALACLFVDLQTFTFQQLLDRVLKTEMAFAHPTVMCDNFFYEEGDDLEEDEVEEYNKLLPKTIATLPGNVAHNTRLDVTDQAQNLKVTLVLQQQVVDAEKHPSGYILEGSTPVAQEQNEKEAAETQAGAAAPATDAKDNKSSLLQGQVIDLLDDEEVPKVGEKRKLSDGAGPSSEKMQKTDDVIELD